MGFIILRLEYGVKTQDFRLIKEFNYQDYKNRLS